MSSVCSIKEEPSYLTPRVQEFKKIVINENIPKRFSFSLNDKSEDAIAVMVRVKPYKGDRPPQLLSYNGDDGTVVIKKNKMEHSFQFTHIIQPEINQDEVFRKYVIKKIQKLIVGDNSLIFTYGASNSGKTFTAHGDRRNPGIIPRALVTLFKSLNMNVDVASPLIPYQHNKAAELAVSDFSEIHAYKKKITSYVQNMISQSTKYESYIPFSVINELSASMEKLNIQKNSVYSVWLSFYEIYNEKMYDLLDEDRDNRQVLRIMADKHRVPYIRGLKHIPVNNLQEAYFIYMYGRFNLSIFGTGVNDQSSRSHSVFTIDVIERPSNERGYGYFNCSSFSVCDLAGTEKCSRTMNTGLRLKESQVINSSILVLNKCLRIIRDNQKSEVKMLVPYRESKLTQVLAPALTAGGTDLSVIVTISQDDNLIDETEVTLKNCSVATKIKVIEAPCKKARFSMAISQCAPGSRVMWNAVAAQQPPKKGVGNKEMSLELMEERKKREEAEANLIKYQEELADLKALLQEQKYEQINEEKNELEEECVNLRVQYLKAQKMKRIASDELAAERSRRIEMEERAKKYEDLLDAAQEEVTDLQETVHSLEEESLRKDQEINDLKGEILAEAQEKEFLRNELLNSESTIANLKKKIDELQEEMNRIIPTIVISPEPSTAGKKGKTTKYAFRNNTKLPVVQLQLASDSEVEAVSPEQKSGVRKLLNDYSSGEDPDFLAPSRPRTRMSEKKRNAGREKKLPDHFHGNSYESDASEVSSNVRSKKKLFHRRSSIDLGNVSDMLEINQTQASPGRIIQRALRTRKN